MIISMLSIYNGQFHVIIATRATFFLVFAVIKAARLNRQAEVKTAVKEASAVDLLVVVSNSFKNWVVVTLRDPVMLSEKDSFVLRCSNVEMVLWTLALFVTVLYFELSHREK